MERNNFVTKISSCSNAQLKKFVDLAENSNGLQLQSVIIQALEANGLYVFAELLGLDSVKAMEKDDMNDKYWRLLNIFTYGTLQTFREEHENLPSLTPPMVKKLQLLTLMTLASDTKYLSYERLSKELCIENIRELEDLLISAIYEDIILGRLDQLNSRLEVDWSAGRDVKYNDMVHIISTLNSWCGGCEKLLTNIEGQVMRSDNHVVEEAKKKTNFNQEVESALANLRKSTSQTDYSAENPLASVMASRMSGQPLPSAGVIMDGTKTKKSKVKAFRPGGKLWSTKN